jgi:phosphatidylglycerol:prolipoprotein diacylglycerol transferase
VLGPRHPSQLYEAFLEGIVLFLVLRYLTHARKSFATPGLTAGVFLVGYGAFRIFVETFFRVGSPFPFFPTPYLSAGLIYSLPMVVFGLYLIGVAVRRRPLVTQ